MNAIITGLTAQWNPFTLGKPLLPAGLEHETARTADQRLTYWAPSSLSRYAGTGTCVSSCTFKHVNIPPSTTRLVLLKI